MPINLTEYQKKLAIEISCEVADAYPDCFDFNREVIWEFVSKFLEENVKYNSEFETSKVINNSFDRIQKAINDL